MTYEERLAREKAIGEMNMAKKVAAAKSILEETIQRAQLKVQKQAAKGKNEWPITYMKVGMVELMLYDALLEAAKAEAIRVKADG